MPQLNDADRMRSAVEPLRVTRSKRALAALIRAALSLVARIHMELPRSLPREGPLIVAANHASNADGVLLAAWVEPALGRPIRYLAKEQLFRTPLRPLLEWIGAIMVRAGGKDVDAYRQARAALHRGEVVGIFPEGHRSPDGVLGRVHEGTALLALRSGAAVLPVALTGTGEFLPRGAILPRVRTRIGIRVGEPFALRLDTGVDRRTATTRAADELMGRIAALLPAEQRGPYARLASPEPAPAADLPPADAASPARHGAPVAAHEPE